MLGNLVILVVKLSASYASPVRQEGGTKHGGSYRPRALLGHAVRAQPCGVWVCVISYIYRAMCDPNRLRHLYEVMSMVRGTPVQPSCAPAARTANTRCTHELLNAVKVFQINTVAILDTVIILVLCFCGWYYGRHRSGAL